ncbi:redox-sensing transcriptional repressor [Anaerobranca californiensis DSM 14826]|jgi:redox-sensing transcriptional repressor|uniref:Redox-sensing transcriptional repressor Rex n=1 Tax=Anaerobranca californiensis DSM 14826 TaxID=1120989 RepID=A0A1M6NLN5_9FIRM|nr:redox-sensing transcriptional repressor Rex [Anaerobranca californiensis]SHJ96514.1 redox-sensing transcriptional repressor [Anaerobranca californiensis DSM 14826]
MTKIHKIPDVVIKRLPIYLRYLQQLMERDIDTVSSQQMGEDLNLNPAQIRKDLSIFGDFGVKGMGYRVTELAEKLISILGLDKQINIALVGVGNLGAALCQYNRYQNTSTKIVAIFDGHPAKVGQKIGNLVVHPMEDLSKVVKELNIKMAIIAVPAQAAQGVADQLIDCGIKVILNFAPTLIQVPPGIKVQNADVTTELQSLAYYL